MPNPPRYTGIDGSAYTPPAAPRTRPLSAQRTLQRYGNSLGQYYAQRVAESQQDYNQPIGSWSQMQSYIRYYTQPAPLIPQEAQPMFNIGDNVYYYSESKNKRFYGKVKTTPINHLVEVVFEQDFQEAFGHENPIYAIHKFYIKHGAKEPELPTEVKVANKCKKLWNQSKFVKQHPQMAY